MDPRLLTPIPTPPAQRWREVRLLYLPRALFVLGIIFVAWAWREAVTPSTLVAEAEVLGSDLRASQSGVVASVKVGLHQRVHAGEVVGFVSAANARLLDATLAVINADVGMLRATMSGATDRQRVALSFERMLLDWMNHRVDRAAINGRLQQSEIDLTRAEPLHRSGLITDESYEQLRINRDSLKSQFEEKNKLVVQLEPLLQGFITSDAPDKGIAGDTALAAALKVQEAKLRLAEEQLAPLPIVAPFDGVITVVLRRTGDTVMAGDPVLRLASTKPDRLAGYLRQPLTFTPKPGMTARIRTRGVSPKSANTTITEVDATMGVIPPTVLAAMHLPPNTAVETGLRVEFALPVGFELKPGEHVDVFVH